MRKQITILIVSALVFSGTASASGIPTVDVANIIQTTTTALNSISQVANQVEQIRNQIDQFNKLQEQLTQQVRQFDSISGNYNMGTLLNNPAYQDARRFIPTTWQETLDQLDGAMAAAHQRQTQQAARDARAAGQRFAAPAIYPDITEPDAVEYIRQANQVFTQMGVGQSNYQQTPQRITNMEDLGAEIDTATDLKAAIDLQNRINVEQGILMAELIRLNSASHINDTERRADELNRRAADVAMSEGAIAVIPALP